MMIRISVSAAPQMRNDPAASGLESSLYISSGSEAMLPSNGSKLIDWE
jgi:hypothetical protein